MAEVLRAQGEITGHVRGLTERLDGFGHRVGQSMSESGKATHESLARLGERMAIIDKAQQTITALSGQVVELQHILANKQTRGAFGQGRMEAIIRDGLPASAYAFQHTLTNGNRPDCVIFISQGPCLVVDAKFPLEAWNAIRAAGSPEAAKAAEAQFRRDTTKHVQDIADRYFVSGETQDNAIMFVPSESIYADIHERFDDVVQKAYRARVLIIPPSLLMLTIQLVMSLMRDQRMRDQVHLIQREVGKMMEDVNRLGERVEKLQRHFSQANGDVEDILKSARGVMTHGAKIARVEFDGTAETHNVTPLPRPVRAAPGSSVPRPRNGPPELPFNGFEEIRDDR
jgi:DNA recombination protein RmuC